MVNQTPVLPTPFWRRNTAPKAAAGEPVYGIDAHAEIAVFPGPAMLFGSDGEVLTANAEAARLMRSISDGNAPDVRDLIESVAASGRPAIGQIFLPPDPVTGDAQALYYLTALGIVDPVPGAASPSAGTRHVMVLGRDGSAEYAMRNALIASRDLYRDLSRCSSDFSWQTDEYGAFTFVSPKGALGYSAQALNGRRSQDLFDQASAAQTENPFVSLTPVEDAEIILRDADGGIRYCRVDALPVYDKRNLWRGARGVSTDITEAKRQSQALEYMRQRELQARAIVEAANKSLDPVQAFNEAAALLASASGASRCAILGLDNKKRLRVLGISEPRGGDHPSVLCRIELEILDLQYRLDCAPISFVEDGQTHQIIFTSHAGVPNGVIWLQNPAADTGGPLPFTPSDSNHRTLAQTVAGSIGIAIAHDNQMRRLAELSRTDELTGLMNRRAFMEDLHQRHGHMYRVSRMGALLYIDLDNFKPVNDLYGHEAGDRVLKEFANILAGNSRIGDLCARLGGDEFAIWLEDTDAGGAGIKARHLIDEARKLYRLAGVTPKHGIPGVGVSVGIAIADPHYPEQLPELIRRADEVMYQVKRQGKGSLIISQPEPAASVSIQGQG
jgi:diguanylate cyclase (GGDEF)-like protein/PAS domain S-box-containing protein